MMCHRQCLGLIVGSPALHQSIAVRFINLLKAFKPYCKCYLACWQVSGLCCPFEVVYKLSFVESVCLCVCVHVCVYVCVGAYVCVSVSVSMCVWVSGCGHT